MQNDGKYILDSARDVNPNSDPDLGWRPLQNQILEYWKDVDCFETWLNDLSDPILDPRGHRQPRSRPRFDVKVMQKYVKKDSAYHQNGLSLV